MIWARKIRHKLRPSKNKNSYFLASRLLCVCPFSFWSLYLYFILACFFFLLCNSVLCPFLALWMVFIWYGSFCLWNIVHLAQQSLRWGLKCLAKRHADSFAQVKLAENFLCLVPSGLKQHYAASYLFAGVKAYMCMWTDKECKKGFSVFQHASLWRTVEHAWQPARATAAAHHCSLVLILQQM